MGCNGCLTAIFLFFLLGFIFKHWAVVIVVILLLILFHKFKNTLSNVDLKVEKEFESKPGKIYKQCEYCNTKADRNAEKCPKCSQPFE